MTALANRHESSLAKDQAPSSLKAGMSRASSGRYGFAAQVGTGSPQRRTRCGSLQLIRSRHTGQQATAEAPHTRQRVPSSREAKS